MNTRAVQSADIDAALHALEQRAASGVSADVFYRRLVTALAAATDHAAVSYWERVGDGLRRVASDSDDGAAERPSSRRLLAVMRGDGPIALEDESPIVACPVRNAAGPVGVLACVSARDAARHTPTLLPLVAAFAEVADQFELRSQVAELQDASAAAAGADAFTLGLHRARGLTRVCREVAEEGRRLVGCDRLTVLLPARGAWRVAAVSGVEAPSPRSDAVRGVERLVKSAIRLGEPLVVRDGAEQDLPPALANTVDDQREATGVRELAVVPCCFPNPSNDSKPRVEAVLYVEQFAGTLHATAEQSLPLVADHAAAAIDNARHAGPLGRVRRRLSSWGVVGGLRRVVAATLILGAIAASVAALVLIPAELTVPAQGRLVPLERNRVFAPMDATVARVLVDHADMVEAGQALVELRSEELEIQLEEALEAVATTRQEIESLETAKLRAGLPGSEGQTDISAMAARVESLREQAVFQQRRVELLRERQSELVVTSPLAGRVMSWRPQDYLAYRPVRRGQRLLEVASPDGGWALEIDVPDRRAGRVLQAARTSGEPLRVEYVLKSAPSARHAGRVVRIASATEANAVGEPTLRVDVEPIGTSPNELTDNPATWTRSGMTVQARIECGEHCLGYVWFHEAWDALQRAWF